MQKFESTLHFSSYFAIIQGVILVGALACIFSLSIGPLFKSILVLGILGHGLWNIYRPLPWQIIGHDETGWYLKDGDKKIDIDIGGDSTVTSLVSILRFKLPEKRLKETLILFKDAMPTDSYRQFIVRMKYFVSHPKIR